jgi:hypothetical protein
VLACSRQGDDVFARKIIFERVAGRRGYHPPRPPKRHPQDSDMEGESHIVLVIHQNQAVCNVRRQGIVAGRRRVWHRNRESHIQRRLREGGLWASSSDWDNGSRVGAVHPEVQDEGTERTVEWVLSEGGDAAARATTRTGGARRERRHQQQNPKPTRQAAKVRLS